MESPAAQVVRLPDEVDPATVTTERDRCGDTFRVPAAGRVIGVLREPRLRDVSGAGILRGQSNHSARTRNIVPDGRDAVIGVAGLAAASHGSAQHRFSVPQRAPIAWVRSFREVGRSVHAVALLRYLADSAPSARVTAATDKVES